MGIILLLSVPKFDTHSPLKYTNNTLNLKTFSETTIAKKLPNHKSNLIVLLFLIFGLVLTDFGCDACQTPSRTYMLEILPSQEHHRGLSYFTLMAGLGGTIGYAMQSIDWQSMVSYHSSDVLSHSHITFYVALVCYILCVLLSISTQKEKTLQEIINTSNSNPDNYESIINDDLGETNQTKFTNFNFKNLYASIVNMPKSMYILCLTNYFSWISLVCYSLYFTSFVGTVIYKGNPTAAALNPNRILYDNGVRFGSFSMSFYTLSSSLKQIYFFGHFIYSIGSMIMFILPYKYVTIILSPTVGIMYATLFTIPYRLVAIYHEKNVDSARRFV
ncbi:Membrane-associated transporter protein [Intoshia linei]|uniref:Membrane-associated transporter protein n=1 Tax=Intoshia linei TaxID=1819745 RepID=A0A177B8T3_9BILA|nr:Membrane-associated transporter protein [Intoshia linei]